MFLYALSFTPTEISALVLASITALGIAAVNIIVAWRTSTKVDSVAIKTERIEAHVNSEKTADQKTIEGLRREILLKQQVIDEKDRAAALLAQSAAISTALAQATSTTTLNAGPVAPALLVPLVSSAESSLKQIDQDASAITTMRKNDAVHEMKDKT